MDAIGTEMRCFLVGPMPVEAFLNASLPIASIPNYKSLKRGSFKVAGQSFNKTIGAKDELGMYDPFVSVF